MTQSAADDLKPLVSEDEEGHDNFRNIKLKRKEEFGVYLPSQIDDQIRYDLSKKAIIITLIAFLICIVFLIAFLAIPILISPAVHGNHGNHPDTTHTGNETHVVEDSTAGHTSTGQPTRRSTAGNHVGRSTLDHTVRRGTSDDVVRRSTASTAENLVRRSTLKNVALGTSQNGVPVTDGDKEESRTTAVSRNKN